MSWGTTEERSSFITAVLVEIPTALLLIGAVVTLSKMTATFTARLRGRPVVPLRQAPLVAVPISLGASELD